MSITETEERLTKLETTVDLEVRGIHSTLNDIKDMVKPVARLKTEHDIIKSIVIFFLSPLVVGLLVWAITKHF